LIGPSGPVHRKAGQKQTGTGTQNANTGTGWFKPQMDSPGVVYFPQVYMQENHGGQNKDAVLHDPRFCVFPGWSVGLVEPYAGLPQPAPWL